MPRPTSPRPPSLASSRAGPSHLFFPAAIAVAAFISGLLVSSTVRPHLAARPSLPRPWSKLKFPSSAQPPRQPHSPRPNNHPIAPQQIPLALQWYKAGYSNPWQFSVRRTGVADLHRAYTRILQRDGKLPRVVVSFTSLPRRFAKHARSTLRLLKKQSFPPDRIYVAIPKTSRRSREPFRIPSWLAKDPLVTVLRPELDYGPATKLIPALLEEKRLGNENTRVVTVDDDNEGGWTEGSLLELLAYSLVFEDAAIGLTGWNVTCMVTGARCSPEDSGVPHRQHRERWYNFVKQADDYACHSLADWLPDYFANCMGAVRKNFVAFADVIEGYRGALYQPGFFDVGALTSILDRRKTPEGFFLCDDVWFSGWLGVKGVKRVIVNPAIHENAEVRKALVAYGKSRKLGKKLELVAETLEDKRTGEGGKGKVEDGLHTLGVDFTAANHEAVRWFEGKGAWTKGMWDRPEGFVYPSERNGGGNKTATRMRRK